MIGQYIQNYKITDHLGEGGMGVVYKAVDNILGREVALKMLHTSMIRQPQVLERFKKEAQVLAKLLHPNIAVIYNFIEQDGQYFMVMEYVEGKNLDALARTHQVLPPKTIVAMFLQALEGLHHAHRKGIFHRDIKPSNLILTQEGTVKLMDFGIAKIAGEQKLTQVNRVIGTVEFMAPEIIEGKEPSVASDIYAAGITMYELLSGRLPFESASDYSLMQDILKKKPVHLATLNASVPPVLANIVMKALEKKPEQRFTDARDFQHALLNAFPGYRDIDLSILAPAAQPLYATRQESIAAFGQGHPTVVASMETRLESTTKAATGLKQFERKILLNKKAPFVLAGTGVLIFLIAFLSVRWSKDPAEKDLKKVVAKTERVKKQDYNASGGSLPVQPPVVKPNPQPPLHAIVLPDEKTDQGTAEKPAKKETAKKVARKEAEKKQIVPEPAAPEEKKVDPPPVVKKEKKEITLKGKIVVSVSMRETIARDDDDKEQPVSFTVNTPVVYEGITIISAGALARGNIRIGRVVSLVSISSVTGTNGQQIQLNGHDHRKVKKLASDRDYTAFVEKGIRMSF